MPPRPAESTFETVDPRSDDRWDHLVALHPQADIFHSTAWTRLLADAYGFQPAYLLHCVKGQPVSGAPLLQVGGRWRGRRGVALPFTDTCPFLLPPNPSPLPQSLPTPDVLEGLASHLPLLSHALALSRQRQWSSLEFRDVTPWFPLHSSKPSVEFFHHTIHLEDGDETAFNRCDSSVRRSVRKAQGTGLQVVEAHDIPAVHAYFQLHSLTRQRHGLPPQPYDFFLKLHQHLLAPGLGSILLVLRNQAPIAGAVFLFWGRRALYKFGASDLQHQALRPNNLLFRDALRLCQQRHCSTLDLGRTSLEHDGLRRFKLGWGGQERRLAYLRYHVPTRQIVPTPDRASGWHTAFFRLLPRPLASLVGRIGYRFAA